MTYSIFDFGQKHFYAVNVKNLCNTFQTLKKNRTIIRYVTSLAFLYKLSIFISPTFHSYHYSSSSLQCNSFNVRDMEFTVDKLGEFKEYEFRVSAVNSSGKGDPSAPTSPIKIQVRRRS